MRVALHLFEREVFSLSIGKADTYEIEIRPRGASSFMQDMFGGPERDAESERLTRTYFSAPLGVVQRR